MEIHQAHHHHHHHHHQKINYIYLILGIILLMPLIWNAYGSDLIGKWHPFRPEEYSLAWYFTLTAMRLKPVLYLIVAILSKKRHFNLIYGFIAYESIMFVDHILFYSQSSFTIYNYEIGMRMVTSFLLAIYMIWYHHKYENNEHDYNLFI